MAEPRQERRKIATLEQIKKDAAKARLPYDKDALLNLAFYLDHQYVEWNAADAGIKFIDRKHKHVPRPVSNKIMHFVLKQHASALEAKPAPDVMPATDDPQDISTASVAVSYLKWLNEPTVADIYGELSDAVMWALASAEGYLKWGWNKAQNRPDCMACSPLEVYPDPYAKKFNNCRYVIHEQFMDVTQIQAMYGKEIKPTTASKADVQKALVLRDMGMAPVLQGATVNEIWVKPDVDSRWPKGLFAVWTGEDWLVPPQDFPYDHGRLPFTQVGAVPRPGSLHYTCTVKYLRSSQMELNKYHAQRIAVRSAFANPKYWVPTELELETDPDDSPNQILRGSGNSGLEPKILQPTTFPENSDGGWIVEEMRDVAGQHETSQGRVPGRVEAARAIEMLKASDDSHLHNLQDTMAIALADGYWQLLMLAAQYGPTETILQTYSREGLPEVKRFRKENLKPGMRVNVRMGTGLADSRAARQDQAMLLWQNGIIRDPEVMADLMDIPVGTLTPQKVYDVRLARNENLAMAEGEGIDGKPGVAIVPNSWDDHRIHIREHNNFRKTSEYENLDPEIKNKFEFHVEQHESLELEELQKEAQKAQLQMAAQGGGMMPPPEEAPPESEGAEGAEMAPPNEAGPEVE